MKTERWISGIGKFGFYLNIHSYNAVFEMDIQEEILWSEIVWC